MRRACTFVAIALGLSLGAACEKSSDDASSQPTTPTPAPPVSSEVEPVDDSGAFVPQDPVDPVDPENPAGDEAGTPAPGALVLSDDPCTSDADCVPQQCCHATSCGLAANAESCAADTACTMDCRAGTMDCGGGCLCQEGKCAARLAPAVQ